MTLSIHRRARLWGDRAAIVDVSEDRLYAPAKTVNRDRISYADLATAADRAASFLASEGIGSGDTVCSLTRNRAAALALLYACRRRGATLAPLSHRLTPATVGRPLEALGPDLVVHEPAQRDLVRDLAPAETATFEAVADADASSPETAPATEGNPPLLALHGDEGTPVAAFSAAAVEANCVAAVATWGLGRRDVAPVPVPLSTYDGLLRIALPLLYVGGTLLVDRAFDPHDALRAMAREGATVLPGRAAEFRELVGRDGFDEALGAVEWAVTETPVADEVRDAYLERGVPLARATGRLECPNAFAVTPDRIAAEPSIDDALLGRPALGCEAALVGDRTTGSTPGEGPLRLSGPGLARGYVEASDGDRVPDTDDAGSTGATGEEKGDEDRDRRADGDIARAGGAFVDGEDGRAFDVDGRVRRDEDGDFYRV